MINKQRTIHNLEVAAKVLGREVKSDYIRMSDDQWEQYCNLIYNPQHQEEKKAPTREEDATLDKLRERYTDEEIAQLIKGEGVKNENVAPTPIFHGKHFRVGVMSDTHIGSIYSPQKWLTSAFNDMEEMGCSCILHCGDLVDGLKAGRESSIMECDAIGFKAQKERALQLLARSSLPIYMISGNHDHYYSTANIVEDICNELPHLHYLGYNQANVDFDGAKVRLFHGMDGNSYAKSYRLQKLVESYTGGEKPQVVLTGHVHKFAYIFERNIHAISVPCLQRQTKFMEGKKIGADIGYLICDFEVQDGQICRFRVEYKPFFC